MFSDRRVRFVICVLEEFFLVHEKHTIYLVNKSFQQHFGLEKEQIIGQYCPRLVHGLDHPFHGCPLEEAVSNNQNVQREIQYSDNYWISSGIYFTNFFTTKGKRLFIHYAMDISKRKLAEKELIRAKEELELLNKKLEKINELGKIIVSVQNKLIYVKDKQVLVDTVSREIKKFNNYIDCFLFRKKDEEIELLNSRTYFAGVKEEEYFNFIEQAKKLVNTEKIKLLSTAELAIPAVISLGTNFCNVFVIPMFSANKSFGAMMLLTARKELNEHEEVILKTIANETAFTLEMLELNEEKEKA